MSWQSTTFFIKVDKIFAITLVIKEKIHVVFLRINSLSNEKVTKKDNIRFVIIVTKINAATRFKLKLIV